MNATGKRRLLKLADFLETKVPRKRFDVRLWADDDFTATKCGTAACAFGWATTIPSFRKAGLSMGKMGPLFFEQEEMAASTSFFDITFEQADFLFMPSAYGSINPTPRYVAKRIRKFVAGAQP